MLLLQLLILLLLLLLLLILLILLLILLILLLILLLKQSFDQYSQWHWSIQCGNQEMAGRGTGAGMLSNRWMLTTSKVTSTCSLNSLLIGRSGTHSHPHQTTFDWTRNNLADRDPIVFMATPLMAHLRLTETITSLVDQCH